ncbi:hypothetical protein AAFF_G00162850 [Aldrovandia affinis]|uniref:SOGA 1/2-like coiled-coil domain-containing protein n=1 Tax=Aldrovandia affinis TaxID=143900 RepID=A0AAD7WW60_9TELE|nr:hypothetical protein AAFF_G00162850 [Aldrovandia affinis]
MWSAFGTGSGLHESGGGGYVSKVEGWEFVPCSSRSERERGRGKSRSPPRTLSSPASVGPLYEQPLPPGLGGVTSGKGARAPQASRHELQTQHCRLRKKFEDLKKRHGQDKDDWMREKELLLRQVADIQGGENRRILLDLKSVLEEVQVEVKREETERNELQLQYTKDRCAWDLERAELKCRIAQLEVRGSKVGVEASVTPDPRETLRREREQQKRLLADTHTAAMDLRCRIEHSERGWVREKSELLERFDAERKEWEGQLRDMQRKIEELYNDVKVRREGVDVGPDSGTHSGALRLSLQSASTSSSILTDPQDLLSNSDSDPSNRHSNGYSDHADCHSNGHSDRHGSSCSQTGDRKSQGYGDVVDRRGDSGRDSGTTELELILQGCPEQGFENDPSPTAGQQGATELELILQRCLEQGFENNPSPYVNPLASGNDKKKDASALNAALKEIARVSEELCSYQDVIRKKSEHRRSGMERFSFLEEFEEVENVKKKAGKSDPIFDLSQWCEQFQSVEEHNWVNWESTNRNADKADEEAKPSHKKRQAPPIPPRTTSWHLNGPTAPEIDFPVPESFTDRKCHSPCILMDRKCPSVLRKFGVMLQENEGYTLTDSGVEATPGPVDSKCHIGCCHSRWSCSGSRFGSSKSSTYVPVQKRPPDANVSGMDCSSDYRQPENPKCPEVQLQSMNIDFAPLDFRVSPSGKDPPPYQSAKGPRRNETLERKTAEFNRTLFQAEMGRGVEDGVTPTEVSVSARNSCSPQHPEIKLRDVTSDLPPQYLNTTPKVVTSDLPLQNPEIKPKVATSDLPPQCPSVTPKVVTSDLPLQYPEIKPKVATSDLTPQYLQDRESEGPRVESNLSAFRQYVPSVNASTARAKSSRVRTVTAARRASGARTGRTSYARGTAETGSWVMKDQPWKPTTLAAYPRPADSRSNYGAVEKILQSYESCSAGSQRYLQHRPSPAQEDDLIELLDMLEVTSGQKASRRDTPTKPGLHREKVSTIQDSRESTFVSMKKSFSRPACPANRRLPSRWAPHSPTAPSAPTTHPTLTTQTQTFSYSFHTETVII